jgi:hypothetical protein
MHLRPTLNYETPQPRKSTGFLSKLNPKATPRSVLRRVVRWCVIASAIWGVALTFGFKNPDRPRTLYLVLILCVAIAAAANEWQVPRKDDPERPPEAGA